MRTAARVSALRLIGDQIDIHIFCSHIWWSGHCVPLQCRVMEKFPRSHWCQIQLIFILNHVPSCSYSCSESDWLHTRQWAPSQTAQMPHAENTLKPDDILSAIYLPQVQDYVSSLELRPAFPFPWHYEISINKVYFFCSSYAHFISEGLQMCSVTKSVRGEQITGRFHVSLASVAENCLRSTIIDPQSDVFIPATWGWNSSLHPLYFTCNHGDL